MDPSGRPASVSSSSRGQGSTGTHTDLQPGCPQEWVQASTPSIKSETNSLMSQDSWGMFMTVDNMLWFFGQIDQSVQHQAFTSKSRHFQKWFLTPTTWHHAVYKHLSGKKLPGYIYSELMLFYTFFWLSCRRVKMLQSSDPLHYFLGWSQKIHGSQARWEFALTLSLGFLPKKA